MAVFIRTDGHEQIGLGHLMRCLALAQEFSVRQVDVVFFVRQPSVSHCRARHDWEGKIVVIPDSVSQSEESAWLREHKLYNQCSLLVLDGYQFDSSYRQQLNALKPPLVLFDDNNNSGVLHCDAVINGASGAQTLGYEKTSPDALHLCGEDYRVLRQEFLTSPDVPVGQRNSITVIMGGADSDGHTITVLNTLAKLGPDIPVRLITGNAFAHKDALKTVLQQVENPVQHLENCQSVADIFAHSRVAISAAGSTQFELHSCATPSVFVITAENQRFSMQQMHNAQWARVFDATGSDTIIRGCKAAVEEAVSLYHDVEALEVMHKDALSSRNNTGVMRVVDALQGLI